LLFWIRVVKTPLTSLQKVVEMLFWNAIEFTHVTLGLVPKVLNPIDVIMLVCEQL